MHDPPVRAELYNALAEVGGQWDMGGGVVHVFG